MKLVATTFSLLLGVLVAVPATAAVLKVPDDYATIQEGINAAARGDTVLVAPGVYAGEGNSGLTFGGKPVSLRSEAGAASTVIRCSERERAVSFDGADEDSTLTVHGFTLSSEHQLDPALVFIEHGAAPVIEDCVFESLYRIGVVIRYESSPTFRRSIFQTYSRSVECTESSGPRFFSCQFSGNTGGAVRCRVLDAPYPLFSGCLFENNLADLGGGICVRSNAVAATDPQGAGAAGEPLGQLQILNCTFVDNNANYGGAFACIEQSPAEIVLDGCAFIGNGTTASGGAIYNIFGSVRVSRSLFLRNSSPMGGALFATTGLSVVRCTLVGNEGSQSSGVHVPPGGTGLEVERTIIALGVDGPAVECGSGDISFVHCVVFGNVGGDGLCGNHDNISADPLFCNADAEKYSLCEDSVCLPGGNPWGELIGAFPRGCPPCATEVDEMSWGRIKALYE